MPQVAGIHKGGFCSQTRRCGRITPCMGRNTEDDGLVRLSISIEAPLARELERLVDRSGYENRSEFVRDLIRKELVDEEWQGGAEVLGTITLLYDHHRRGLSDRLNALQHDHHAN